jgi:uncharacterized protein (TIGR00725 family)
VPISADEEAAVGYIGVVGPSDASADEVATAVELGRGLAERGHVVVCGGLGGVMAAVSRGAAEAGGVVVGLLPGLSRSDANPHVTVAIPTGLGELRNGLLVRSSDVVVSIGGSWGTLSEVALAVRTGVPVVAVHGWPVTDDEVPRPTAVSSAAEALAAVDDLFTDPRYGTLYP